MTPNYEQAFEIISNLPIADLKKLGKWIEEKTKTKQSPASKEEIEKFRLSMKWIDENRQKFLGQWVCLDGDRLVAHGTDALKIYKKAREKGIEVPFVEHIVEEKEAYGGGIEACPQL